MQAYGEEVKLQIDEGLTEPPIKLQKGSDKHPKITKAIVVQMRFTHGKKQKVDGIDLDLLFSDLRDVLVKHKLVPEGELEGLISEWINDMLFLAGKITEEELKEAMKAFEEEEVGASEVAAGDDEDEDEDEDEED